MKETMTLEERRELMRKEGKIASMLNPVFNLAKGGLGEKENLAINAFVRYVFEQGPNFWAEQHPESDTKEFVWSHDTSIRFYLPYDNENFWRLEYDTNHAHNYLGNLRKVIDFELSKKLKTHPKETELYQKFWSFCKMFPDSLLVDGILSCNKELYDVLKGENSPRKEWNLAAYELIESALVNALNDEERKRTHYELKKLFATFLYPHIDKKLEHYDSLKIHNLGLKLK